MTKDSIHENLNRWISSIDAMMIGRLDAMCKRADDKDLEEFRDRLKKLNSAMKLMREQIEIEGITR